MIKIRNYEKFPSVAAARRSFLMQRKKFRPDAAAA
jgi:hypothetical protein